MISFQAHGGLSGSTKIMFHSVQNSGHQENGEEKIIHYNLWQKFFVG